MRKIVAYGAAALLALSAGATGVSFAQDTTTETETAAVAIEKAWLGVSVSESDAGVIITRVATGSPAEAAGLEVDDVIVAAGDTAITTVDELLAVVDAAAVGDVISLTVTRADEELSVDVTLEARQRGIGGRSGMFADPLQATAHALGVTVEEADSVYTVTAVDEDAPVALEVGDVITAVNGEVLASLDWRSLVGASAETTTITVTVERDGEEVSVEGALAAFTGRQGMPGGDGQHNGGQRGGNPPNGHGDGQQPNDAPAADGAV